MMWGIVPSFDQVPFFVLPMITILGGGYHTAHLHEAFTHFHQAATGQEDAIAIVQDLLPFGVA